MDIHELSEEYRHARHSAAAGFQPVADMAKCAGAH
jgi:hypothetical protein